MSEVGMWGCKPHSSEVREEPVVLQSTTSQVCSTAKGAGVFVNTCPPDPQFILFLHFNSPVPYTFSSSSVTSGSPSPLWSPNLSLSPTHSVMVGHIFIHSDSDLCISVSYKVISKHTLFWLIISPSPFRFLLLRLLWPSAFSFHSVLLCAPYPTPKPLFHIPSASLGSPHISSHLDKHTQQLEARVHTRTMTLVFVPNPFQFHPFSGNFIVLHGWIKFCCNSCF